MTSKIDPRTRCLKNIFKKRIQIKRKELTKIVKFILNLKILWSPWFIQKYFSVFRFINSEHGTFSGGVFSQHFLIAFPFLFVIRACSAFFSYHFMFPYFFFSFLPPAVFSVVFPLNHLLVSHNIPPLQTYTIVSLVLLHSSTCFRRLFYLLPPAFSACVSVLTGVFITSPHQLAHLNYFPMLPTQSEGRLLCCPGLCVCKAGTGTLKWTVKSAPLLPYGLADHASFDLWFMTYLLNLRD